MLYGVYLYTHRICIYTYVYIYMYHEHGIHEHYDLDLRLFDDSFSIFREIYYFWGIL